MKRITTLAMLGLFALSGATLVGCSASADVEPQHTNGTVGTGTSSDVKTTTTYDANGNKVDQRTTQSKTTSPGY